MANRIFIRPETQIMPLDVYDDTFDITTAYTGANNLQDVLNYIHSAIKDIKGVDFNTPVANAFNVQAIADKIFSPYKQKLDDVTVPATQNYVTLTGATKPTDNIAIGATTKGAIVAQLVGAIGSHNLDVATSNRNLLEVRDAALNDPIYTGGNKIYGLLQVGNLATDGNAFGDTGNDQAQISFVYIDPATDAIAACPVADIENKTIEYAYRSRTDFFNLSEDFISGITFVDSVALGNVDLQAAYDNDTLGDILLATAKNFTIDLNSNADVEIKDGATSRLLVDRATGATRVNGDLDVLAENDLKLYDADNSNFVSLKSPTVVASNVSFTLPAVDGSSGQFLSTDGTGQLSFANPLGTIGKATYVLSSNIAANTNINISSFTNPYSIDFGANGTDFVNNYAVYLNGVLRLLGADASADNDCYWVDVNNIAFEYQLKGTGSKPDILTVIKLR